MPKVRYDFGGQWVNWSADGKVGAPEPWIPSWKEHAPEDQDGEIVRPEYYRKDWEEDGEYPVLAVNTRYATHAAGVFVGPITPWAGSEVALTIVGRQHTTSTNGGDGSMYPAYMPIDPGGGALGRSVWRRAGVYQPYDRWYKLACTFHAVEEQYWIGGWGTWKWRAAYCTDYWREMTVMWTDAEDAPRWVPTLIVRFGDQVWEVPLNKVKGGEQ